MTIKIGAFATLNHVSVQTLRLYDKMGLLRAAYIDEETGYRYYNIGQCMMLDTILYLRSIDMSLADIQEYIRGDEDIVMRLMETQQEELAKQKKHIATQQFSLDQRKRAFQEYEHYKYSDSMDLIECDNRYVYLQAIDKDVYAMSDDEYEYELRVFKNNVKEQDIDLIHFVNVGTRMKQASFENGSFQSHEMMVFVPKNLHNHVLQKGTYAVRHVFEFQSEKETLKTFQNEIKAAGYTVCGDYYCEVLAEKPYHDQKQRSMFIRMQVKVCRSML